MEVEVGGPTSFFQEWVVRSAAVTTRLSRGGEVAEAQQQLIDLGSRLRRVRYNVGLSEKLLLEQMGIEAVDTSHIRFLELGLGTVEEYQAIVKPWTAALNVVLFESERILLKIGEDPVDNK